MSARLQIDPSDSKLELWTYKEGLLSGVAHDLCFRAEGLQVTVEVADDDAVEVTVVVRLEQLVLMGQVKQGHVSLLKPKDAADIRKNLSGARVLDVARHPELRYVGRGPREGQTVALSGDLTLRGTTKALPLQTRWSDEDGKVRVEGEVRFAQSDWGIKPFSALLGSLRVRDELRVSWSLLLQPEA